MKKKQIYFTILQWILVTAAYGYLAYRLSTFDDYASLLLHFKNAGWLQWSSLTIAVILFPLNIFCEAAKWRYLLREVEPMSLGEAQRQTYFGFVGAFLTPSRLGDYPARVMFLRDKSNWLTAVALGFVGTLALAFIQVLCGLPACIILFNTVIEQQEYRISLTILCVCILILQIVMIVFYPVLSERLLSLPLKHEKFRLLLRTLAHFSHKQFFLTCMLSILRYVVYCLQLWCVLLFCGVQLDMYEAFVTITAYYLLVTITPSVPIADAAVRGSWSIVIFGAFTTNIAGVAMAAVLLWLLNSILPMIVGTFVRKK